MTILVPIMLFGWVPLTIIFFNCLSPHRAVLFAVIGGWLFLPMAGYDLPGFPAYSKSMAIALGLILGGCFSGNRQETSFAWKIYDFPIVLWCLSPLLSSLTNQLGLYDGLSVSLEQIVVWGVPYFAGRIYFTNHETLRDLGLGIVIGGVLYVPLCFFEVIMSPRLHIFFYGFFQHDWLQHKRYGGWRPIVFMRHGLMVALWMASSFTIAYWFWRKGDVNHIKGIPMSFIVTALMISTLLCKSANGWFFLVLGCGAYFMRKYCKIFLFVVPLYLGLRISGLLSGQDVEIVAATVFDPERISSLAVRLLAEDLFIQRALESPLFGWGGYSRGWPVDPETGRRMINWLDALWLITFSKMGFWGIITLVSTMLMGPWLVMRSFSKGKLSYNLSPMAPLVLCLVAVFFMIDCLLNAMVNPVYIVVSGALVGWYVHQKQ